MLFIFFFFNDTATTEIYTLSLHDALPICAERLHRDVDAGVEDPEQRGRHPERRRVGHEEEGDAGEDGADEEVGAARSEEHTSELQSRQYLVCRLLLEKKKKNNTTHSV